MGVTQLWQILEPVKEMKKLSELRGLTLAVDLSAWIVDSNTVKQMSGTVVKPHLRNLFFRVQHLLQLEITPVFVLEGQAPELKLEVMRKRNRARYGSRGGGARQGNRSQLARVVRECCEMLDYLGLPYVRSSGEAEAMCAFLNEEKMVEACITQDGDAFLYGARTVIRNFTVSGKEPVVEVYCMSAVETKLNLDRERLVGLALLLGCDYSPKGVPGVGKEQAMKLIQGMPKHQSLLERFSQWQSPKYVADLSCETDSRPLPHCQNCGHPGSSRDHTMIGCVMCQSSQYCYPCSYDYKCDCEWHRKKSASESSSAEWVVCRKARQLTCFPDAKIIDEFLRCQNRKPKTTFYWSRPSLEKLWSFNLEVLTWPETYTTEKVLPLLTLWDMRDITGGRYGGGHLVPVRILKTRIRLGVPCYEVEWEKLVDDVYTESEYYTTVEEQTAFKRCFPELVARLEEENGKKPCKKRNKKKATVDLDDDDLAKAMRQSLHLGSANDKCRETAATESAGLRVLPAIYRDRVEIGVSPFERFSEPLAKGDCSNGNIFSNNVVVLNDAQVKERDSNFCYHDSTSTNDVVEMTSATQFSGDVVRSGAHDHDINSADGSDSDEDEFNIPLSQRLARMRRLQTKAVPPRNTMADFCSVQNVSRRPSPSPTIGCDKSDVMRTTTIINDRTIEKVNDNGGRENCRTRPAAVSGGSRIRESLLGNASLSVSPPCFEFDNLDLNNEFENLDLNNVGEKRHVRRSADRRVSESRSESHEVLTVFKNEKTTTSIDCEIRPAKSETESVVLLSDFREMDGSVTRLVKKEKIDPGLAENEIPLRNEQSTNIRVKWEAVQTTNDDNLNTVTSNCSIRAIKTEITETVMSDSVSADHAILNSPVKREHTTLCSVSECDRISSEESVKVKVKVKVEVERESSSNVIVAETNFIKSERLAYDESRHSRQENSDPCRYEIEPGRTESKATVIKEEVNELKVSEENNRPVKTEKAQSVESKVKVETEIEIVFSDEESDCSVSTEISNPEDSLSISTVNENEISPHRRVRYTAAMNELGCEDASGIEGGGFIPEASIFRWDDTSGDEFEPLEEIPNVGFHGNVTFSDNVSRTLKERASFVKSNSLQRIKSEERNVTFGLSTDDVIDLCDSDSDVDNVTDNDVIAEPYAATSPSRTRYADEILSSGGHFIVEDVRTLGDVIDSDCQSASANDSHSQSAFANDSHSQSAFANNSHSQSASASDSHSQSAPANDSDSTEAVPHLDGNNSNSDTILSQTFFARLEISDPSESLDSIPLQDKILSDRTNLLSESILSKDIGELMSEVETQLKKPARKKRTKKTEVKQSRNTKLVDDVIVTDNDDGHNGEEIFSDSFIKEIAGRTMFVPNGSQMTFLMDSSEMLSPLTPVAAKPRRRNNKAKREPTSARINKQCVEVATNVVVSETPIASDQKMAAEVNIDDGKMAAEVNADDCKMAAEVNADDCKMAAEVNIDDGKMAAEVNIDDGKMAAEVNIDDGKMAAEINIDDGKMSELNTDDCKMAAEVNIDDGKMAAELNADYGKIAVEVGFQEMADEAADSTIVPNDDETDEHIYGNFSLMTSLLNFDATIYESSNHP